MLRIESALLGQAAAAAQQVAQTDARFAAGEASVQGLVQALETRLADSERKLAEALTAVTAAMGSVQANLDARLAASEDRVGDAIRQLAAAVQGGQVAPPAQAPAPSPMSMNAGPLPFDPWANAAAAAASATAPGTAPTTATTSWGTASPLAAPGLQAYMGDPLKSKDFAGVQAFDGDLSRFPDWVDRMTAKLGRAHPRLLAALTWAEAQSDPITEAVEQRMNEPGVDVVNLSLAVFDILMERTGPRLFDKRRNAGPGRGLEFWRILKRDFGTSSVDAQLAKLQAYTKPGRCASLQDLAPALDRWEALGRDLTRPVDDDFRLLALRELVPKAIADLMATQVSLRSFPEALMFVRRQVAEMRHVHQVHEVQRQASHGVAPMDLSALMAAIAALSTGDSSHAHEAEAEHSGEGSEMDRVVAALKGKSKGKGKDKNRTEDRECYNCGKVGHLSRDCRSDRQPKGKGKNGKGKGKGKDRAVYHIEGGEYEAYEDDAGISLGCLVRAPAESQLNSCAPSAETWQGYECVEALMDSGAGECVCGPQHFEAMAVRVDPNRAGAGVEYVCADGGRICNMGEKSVSGLSDEGVKLAINFQVTTVDRPLIAVSKLTAAGHQVWFGQDFGTITHGVTGKSTKFHRKNGVYVLKIWVPRPATEQSSSSGGIRQ